MVLLVKTDNPNVFRWKSSHKSWYDKKMLREQPTLNAKEASYIDLLQSTANVQDPRGTWVPYDMTSTQLEFHLQDVTLKQDKAKIRIVKKSRNTSLTVSSAISDIYAMQDFQNPVVPYVRMNSRSALDLIDQVKQIIKHVKPVEIEIPDESKRISPEIDPPTNKVYLPFLPADIDTTLAGSIRWPGESVIRAFPANSDSSETVRGLRLRGNFGFIDEANFMRYFKNIFVAMRDASAGSLGGKSIQQLTIGTTLKGHTPFTDWLESIEKSGATDIKIFDWPVFERHTFQPYIDGNCKIPFHENNDLVAIVPWHDKKKLWNTWLQDDHVFLEEYQAHQVDSDDQFFKTTLTLESSDLDDSLATPHPTKIFTFERLIPELKNYKEIRIGLDPATSHDCFGVQVFGLGTDKHWEQLVCEGPQKIELPDMEVMIFELLYTIDNNHTNWLCSIDATPIGMHLTQTLRRKFASRIRGLNGNMRFENADGLKVKLNEYMLTYIKSLMFNKTIHLVNDELQMRHFASINYEFKAPSTEYGHGDLVFAMGYCLCPLNTFSTESTSLMSNVTSEANEKKSGGDRLLKQYKKRIAQNKRVLR